MKNKTSKTEQFCRSILGLEVKKSKALANLVMGLASQVGAKSVTEVSLSPCYHYQFSSISKAIHSLCSSDDTERLRVEKNFGSQTPLFSESFS